MDKEKVRETIENLFVIMKECENDESGTADRIFETAMDIASLYGIENEYM